MKRIVWLYYKLTNTFRRIFNAVLSRIKIKLLIKCKYKQKRLDAEQAHNKIAEIIIEGKPALIARFGSNEARCTADSIGVKLGIIKNINKKVLKAINNNAGVFPRGQKMALKFSEISIEAAKKVDLLGVWGSNMQDYLVNNVCPKEMFITSLGNLEPYNSSFPWSRALEGKKVLVIHPFKETIEAQYKRRELLFENPNILPKFDLKVIKAVQTIAGEKDDRFDDWTEALEYMYQQTLNEDYDVAIIGCGAYGMPLAAKIKESGKIAIHLGGATQLMFGIKGARWDNHPLSKLYNEYWVRPSENETPQMAKKVEGACYW